jgi:acetylornithine deacetylase
VTVLDLLDDLVRINSVNPGLDPAGAGEAEIAAFVAEWGRRAGLRVETVEGTPGRPSVILRGGRDTGGRRLLLCGHLDTVSLHDPLTPRVDGDRLQARGAYDMKGGLAAALVACRDAAATGIDGEVIVAAVADEERASLGIQDVLAHLDPAGIDAAVVTEPTERQVGTAHRGFVWTEITVTGVAAHGSRPHLGADAILAAGHLLAGFDACDRELRARPHPFLGPGNLHASLIAAGTEESTIPDRCVFTVERRTLPGETVDRVEADVADLLDRCRPADPRIGVSARTVLHRPAMETPHDAEIVRALLAAAGPGTTVAPMSYWADSAFLAAAGIPTALYGPEGDGAHADVEWVSRSGTCTATAVLTRLAQDFC